MSLLNKTKKITKFMVKKKKIKFGIITSSDNFISLLVNDDAADIEKPMVEILFSYNSEKNL